jgi:hypothetical protein
MLRRCAFPLLPALAITAIAVAGCGGSSKKSTTSKAGSTAGSAGDGASTSGLSTSTPLNSPLAQRLFKEEGVTHGLTASQATKFVTCLENKFAAQGIKTFGDASANASRTRLDSAACALDLKTGS